MKLCDLHTHSYFSDGTYSPTEIVREAEKIGLSAVALCDHNTVEGIPELLSAGENSSVKTVAGIELSTDYGETELHMLGLFIPTDKLSDVQAYANALLDRKEQSNRDMIARLAQDGYDITFEAVKVSTPTGRFNRSHVACYLMEKGYVSSVKEAFSTLLAKKSPYYVPVRRVDVFDTIGFLRSVGAVPVLAHPFLDLTLEQLVEFLPMAVEAGQLELNAFEPVAFYRLFESITAMTGAVKTLIDNCVSGITANVERCKDLMDHSVITVTALAPHIGYKHAATIAKTALKTGKTIRELVLEEGIMDEKQLDEVLDPYHLTVPGAGLK